MTRSDAPKPASAADLYAIAYQIEAEAVERYQLLADQMELHNRPELVAIFRDLARIEGLHRAEIARRAGDPEIAHRASVVARWEVTESPESANFADTSYLMTPYEAVMLALRAEQGALDFYTAAQAENSDSEIRRFARELMAEETGHVTLCQRLLQTYPESPEGAIDLDPPVPQD